LLFHTHCSSPLVVPHLLLFLTCCSTPIAPPYLLLPICRSSSLVPHPSLLPACYSPFVTPPCLFHTDRSSPLTTPCLCFPGLPNSSWGPKVGPRVKQQKKNKVAACSLTCNTLGLGECAEAPGWD
jgi:hypothetical protein